MKGNFSWQGGRAVNPKALMQGHDDVRAELVRAIEMPGRVGEAAAEVARLCLPHFEHEEKTVFPILSLLPQTAAGIVRPEMADVLPLVSTFKAWHEVAGEQHQAIAEAIRTMQLAAYKEDNREIVEFGYFLRAHENLEDDVVYPTAIMIGNYVQEKLGIDRLQ